LTKIAVTEIAQLREAYETREAVDDEIGMIYLSRKV
jgi:hypothetical protein